MKDFVCPECGEKIPAGVRVCPNCDYELTDKEYAEANPQTVEETIQPAKPDVQRPAKPAVQRPAQPAAAAPESVMAHGNVDVSQHHAEDNSTHNIDNSQTVHNNTQNVQNNTTQNVQNTFIIMGGGSAPLPPNIDEHTAQAVQQAQAQVQQQHAQQQSNAREAEEADGGEKGIGSIDGRRRPAPSASGSKSWMGIAVVAIVVIGIVYFFFIGGDKKEAANEPAKTEVAANNKSGTSKKSTSATSSNKNTKSATSQPKANTATSTASTAQVQQAPAKPKDANYEKGMQYFNEGNGLEAVKAFKASGSADALYMLGIIYEQGCGSVAANAMMAKKYFKQAADKGSSEAKAHL